MSDKSEGSDSMSELRTLVRETIAAHDGEETIEAREIALEVAKAASPKSLRAYLAEALADTVREEIRFTRTQVADGAEDEDAPRPTNGKVPASRRFQARAGGFLAQRVAVVGGGYKRLADCTAEDIAAVVASYRGRAAQNNAMAEKYERLQVEAERRDLATIGEMGEAAALAIFNGQAVTVAAAAD